MVWMLSGLTDMPDSCLYDDVTGVILAGGQGKRMGSADKGLQLLDGKPLVAHVIDRLRPQVSTLIVNANRNQSAYAAFGYPVCSDEPLDWSGPLAGFLTGLRHCKTLYLVTAPCDAPFLPSRLVEDLHRSLEEKQADLAVAVSKDDEYCRVQPAFCLMKASLATDLENFMARGGRKIEQWYATRKVATACFNERHGFENVNTPDELAWLQGMSGDRQDGAV
ncbi:molybdenum cofactor guanylyltransferase [Oxalobacter sp. OxGP1]|uniref:molybdenum cofactor guanylyltransferase MobA n=1 Tax=Oxalobacter paeniformigenes TaxID=2946594 RepID=UPI0022AE7446|nr:molybdenum cofactor guanylyltransferase MobA [Oxalobacter paeniformigenes]MCZ4052772.1 molybdenum cofactor guanylyltransferase [Oxalobacter paeniformigenes]